MKRREPSKEEILLWRAVTGRDRKLRAELPLDEEIPSMEPATSGTAAKKGPPSTPPKRENSLPPLAPLPVREAKKRLKGHAEIEATLDLHGLGRTQAYERLAQFLAACRRRGLRHVLVITGKGRSGEGVLRASLPHWLNEPGLRHHVAAIAAARPEKGGSGALHVLLRRAI
jgi:DNA-nicking Smr family endonuclease